MSEASAEERAIGERLAEARLAGRALSEFPGPLPRDLAAAYRIQRTAVAATGLAIVGWKAALVAAGHRAALGVDRLFGPVLAGTVTTDADTPLAMPVIVGGSAAFEAELVVRLARDIPADFAANPDALDNYVASIHAGAEFAGNPVAGIGALGPLASVAAFANNAGLYLGPTLAQPTACRFRLDRDGETGAEGTGSWADALAATLRHAVARNHPPRAGDLISTGAIAIARDLLPGEVIDLGFQDGGGAEVTRRFVVKAALTRND